MRGNRGRAPHRERVLRSGSKAACRGIGSDRSWSGQRPSVRVLSRWRTARTGRPAREGRHVDFYEAAGGPGRSPSSVASPTESRSDLNILRSSNEPWTTQRRQTQPWASRARTNHRQEPPPSRRYPAPMQPHAYRGTYRCWGRALFCDQDCLLLIHTSIIAEYTTGAHLAAVLSPGAPTFTDDIIALTHAAKLP